MLFGHRVVVPYGREGEEGRDRSVRSKIIQM